MKLSIRARLLVFFAIALLVFAAVSSLLFRSLFARAVMDAKRTDMLGRAASLSAALGEALEDARPGGRGQAQGGPGGSYTSFVRALSLVEPNLWVLDEELNFLTTGRMMGKQLSYTSLPKEAESLVKGVFQGKTALSEGFSALTGAPTLTVGAPIYHRGQVVGALLLHDAVAGIQAATAQGQRVLLYSAGAALVLSSLLAALLAHSFTRPISVMHHTAQRLSQGDYAARAGIDRPDEIGELAQALDGLGAHLEQASQERQQQEQLRRDFLANVSHELRTPVTVLKASLEAMQDGIVSQPDMVQQYAGQMLKETDGLRLLVDDLLELARLQNTAFPIEKQPLIWQDVVRDALQSAQGLAATKSIRLQEQLANAPLPFLGDYARLRQMLLIVLDNAIKFSPSGSEVQISLSIGRLSIADKGQGIPQADIPQLFQRFHKSRDAENKGGSGLGLAIAREIAQRHNLLISIDSVVGQGTTVHITWDEQAAAKLSG